MFQPRFDQDLGWCVVRRDRRILRHAVRVSEGIVVHLAVLRDNWHMYAPTFFDVHLATEYEASSFNQDIGGRRRNIGHVTWEVTLHVPFCVRHIRTGTSNRQV